MGNLMRTKKPDVNRCILAQTKKGENIFGITKENNTLKLRYPLDGLRNEIDFDAIRSWIYEREVDESLEPSSEADSDKMHIESEKVIKTQPRMVRENALNTEINGFHNKLIDAVSKHVPRKFLENNNHSEDEISAFDKLIKKTRGKDRWREYVEYRKENKEWLDISSQIALVILEQVDKEGINKEELPNITGIPKEKIANILKGRENLDLKTISVFNKKLDIDILGEIYDISVYE